MERILILISILLLPILLEAQDDDIVLPFDNEPLKQEALDYFVLAGGVTFDWLMINDENLNDFHSFPDGLNLSGPIHLTGGTGVTGIPWVKNLRLGVFGYGGSLESEIIEDGNLSQNSLTVSMFGFSVHYGYVPFEHFAILGGLNAGWGDVTFENYSSVTTPVEEINPPVTGMIQRLEKNYFFAMPNIQLEYALANFIIIRADASYNLTIGQDQNWTYSRLGTSTVNPDLDLSGLKIGFGVMVGLVNF
ncbi:MAG: hypothetical protein RIF34_03230 [Candidatus Kapaibacterium sp.]